jgi:GT2 family glycosyltransferase
MRPIARITVAVAACDRPGPVARCLEAILRGATLPAQIVVVDQSSDSGVEAEVRPLVAPGVAVQYIRQPRLGLSASRNAALAAATQPAVAFTDDDCVPDRGWLAAVSAALAVPEPPAAVAGRVLPLGEPSAGTYVVSPRGDDRPTDYRAGAVPWAVGTGGNFAGSRAWLERVGGFDERLGAGSPGRAAEDADLIYRVLRAGGVVRYDPAAVVYHERQTESQRLRSRWTYGFGIAAACALWTRRGDPGALRLLGTWMAKQVALLAGALVRRDGFLARQRTLSLRGGVRGLFYGLRLTP